MQMNHNMGWDGIKDLSLINDKPGWNPLFHGSAIGKLQAPWKHTHIYTCVHRLTDTHMHTHIWHEFFGYFPAWLFQTGSEDVSLLRAGCLVLTCHRLYISLYFRYSISFCQVDGAALRLWGEGKSCLCSVVFCSAQTDAQACVNDSLSPRMSAGCRAACYSLQVKCLWRHMEQGKLTTRGNSPQQREVLLVSPPNKI